ncbi:hypothetical protein VCV18_003437 [Metarhizium anisopliae]
MQRKYRPMFGPDRISQSGNLDLAVTLVELLDIAVVKLACRFKIPPGEINRRHLGYYCVAGLGVLLQPSEELLYVFASSSYHQQSALVAGSEPLRAL